MRMKRILTVVGARPQIIKAAAISRAIAAHFQGRLEEIILHTGQHYDANMSEVFFSELGIPAPAIQLHVGSGTHAVQTARMLEGIEQHLLDLAPDIVLLYGDTNSTLAGALAAAKLRIPVAHVEAGLRSRDRSMPEELNRIVCDHSSTWLFCPTGTAVRNLVQEGFPDHEDAQPTIDRPSVVLSGDVMYDNSLHFAQLAAQRSKVLEGLGLQPGSFVLATIHRDNNTDDAQRLERLVRSLLSIHADHGLPVVWPLHPRTRKRMDELLPADLMQRIEQGEGLKLIPPAGFLDMIALERNSRLVLTDSGGVQKEAFFFGKPVVVLRSTTEWVELLDHGWAVLVDADPGRIANAVQYYLAQEMGVAPALYGDGHAAERICAALAG